ncbi:MAG: peptidyl-prolyl cis-trans isomerase [Prevotella sp.]|nr:peptidyl-prolyl cis-trans isomerase [Prevotella sp.]
MKIRMTLLSLFLCGTMAYAQNDPVIMRINGKPVSRSEFEYSFNKNNMDGVLDRKNVKEYVDLFINYKLKVMAAMDAGIDTTMSFKNEFAGYRDQQILPALVTDADLLKEARNIYEMTKEQIGDRGLVNPAHILIMLNQNATKEEQAAAKVRIDSIYNALKKGADFAELATRVSQDPGSASRGGEIGFTRQGVMVKEFEDQMFALKKGELSKPFLSPFGYHIILLKDKKQFEPFEYHREDILKFIEARNLREHIAEQLLTQRVNENPSLNREDLILQALDSLERADHEMKFLIQEYHDGLLLYEISNEKVWNRAAKDTEGLKAFFKKNKKKYAWVEPRFKGIAYRTQQQSDVEAVKKCVKGLPFEKWGEKLASTFNNDSIIRIRVEKGVFDKGRNALVDREIFKQQVEDQPLEGYPYTGVYGKVLKKGPESHEDVRTLVVADYQEFLEQQWVAELRKKYKVEVDQKVLDTVNNH